MAGNLESAAQFGRNQVWGSVMSSIARGLLILAFSLSAVACGGGDDNVDAGPVDSGAGPDSGIMGPDEDQDQWADDVDNCPSLPNPEQRDRDRDGIGDACDVCPSTPNSGVGGQPGPDACEQVSETEPNNSLEEGQVVALAEMGRVIEITGAVEAPTPDGAQAVDRFKVMVGAQTMLKVRAARASSESLLEPMIVVSGGGYTTPREAHGLFVAEREIYCAEAGTYTISVGDRRGLLEDTPFGSLKYEYGLAVEAVPVPATPRDPPLNAEPFTFDATGRVVILDMTLEAAEFTLIATETDLDVLGTGVDTILVLERPNGQVIENDSLAEGYSDARIIAELATQEMVRLVVDHSRITGSGEHEVRLTVAQPDTTRELEPNDRADLASELVFPGETSGQISAALDPDVGPPDVDWYYLDGRAGQVVALTGLIRPSAVANPAMALVRVHDLEADDIETLYVNTDSSGDSPRIEAILPDDGTYYVVVVDEQNLEGPPFAGGPLFEYGIFAEPTGIQPDPQVVTGTTSIDGLLDPGGRLKRHIVVANEPTLIFIDVDQMGEDVSPLIRVYGPQAKGIIGAGEGSAMAYLPEANSYVVGVHNANNGLGGPTATYQAQVSYQSVVAKVELEPNDTPATANRLEGWRDVMQGELLDEDDIDTFTLTSSGGLTLDAVLSTGGRGRQVQVRNGAGAVIGAGVGGAEGVALPNIDDYSIEVSSAVPGPYTLIVRVY